jgi:hypothetical protein
MEIANADFVQRNPDLIRLTFGDNTQIDIYPDDGSPRIYAHELYEDWVNSGNAVGTIYSPDFAGFQLAALANAAFKAMVAAALAVDPLPALSLPSLLAQVAAGAAPDSLVAAFAGVITAAEPTDEALEGFIAIAQAYHLPEPLIDALLRVHLPG